MFLLHRRLGRVDGFTDAAQLRGEKNDRNELTQPTSPPTYTTDTTTVCLLKVVKR